MKKIHVKQVSETLLNKYSWFKHDFRANSDDVRIFRYLISCITVAGEAEDITFAATQELFSKFPEMYDLSVANVSDVSEILKRHNIQFAPRKAEFIIKTSQTIRLRYNGRVPDTRAELEKLPGVGRHIASVILATLFCENEFAVDFHIRRIFKRLGWLDKGSDRKYEAIVKEYVAPEDLGHLSRSFVDFGQDVCALTPRCSLCEFKWCPNRNEKTEQQGIERQLFEVEYVQSDSDPSKKYAVTVRRGQLKCTCPAYRKCKHIKQIEKKYSLA